MYPTKKKVQNTYGTSPEKESFLLLPTPEQLEPGAATTLIACAVSSKDQGG